MRDQPGPELAAPAKAAIAAWNLMGGTLDWAALPYVCEILGVSDPEALIYGVAGIRDHKREADRHA